MAEAEQPESPPRPFPPRSPGFRRDPFREDRFSRMYNDDPLRNNGASSSADADDPKSCFIAATTFAFFGIFFGFAGWVVQLHDVMFSDVFEWIWWFSCFCDRWNCMSLGSQLLGFEVLSWFMLVWFRSFSLYCVVSDYSSYNYGIWAVFSRDLAAWT